MALGAVAASVCCVGPPVPLGLGISGAWISRLPVLGPYRPIFVLVTAELLGYAFYSGLRARQGTMGGRKPLRQSADYASQ